MSSTTPNTMKAWQFTSTSQGLEHNLYLPASGAPKPVPSPTQVLLEVYSTALNPADYKVPELGLLVKFMVPSPCTPGMDFCGRVASCGSAVKTLKEGDVVFGSRLMSAGNKLGAGSLAQFLCMEEKQCRVVPAGMEKMVDEFAAVGCAALTAWQCIVPNVEKGDKVFINGGSGGCGTWGIQIAKAVGCHVTTSCSTGNVELVKSIGADEVLDYKNVDVVKELEANGQVFKLVVDNVGTPATMYRESHKFLVPGGKFVQVGAEIGIGTAGQVIHNILRPGFLGGGKRKYEIFMIKPKIEIFEQLGKWIQEGKIKAVIDEIFDFEDAPRAFAKLKSGRARGKIIVHIKDA